MGQIRPLNYRMFRRSQAPSYRSSRGASSRSYKSDDTLLTPLIEDGESDSDSDYSDDSSTAASYEGVPESKPSASQAVKLAVGEYILYDPDKDKFQFIAASNHLILCPLIQSILCC